jgi:hypothetical protein
MTAAAMPGGSYLVNWALPSGDSTRGFLRRYDRTGRLIRVYEEPKAGCEMDVCMWEGVLVHRADSAGAVWAARVIGGLEISRYDSVGRLLRRLELEAPWFPRHEPGGELPKEMVTGIAGDGSGHVWLAVTTTDPTAPGSAKALFQGDPDVMDGILEVRDSLTGAVIATRRFDEAAMLVPLGGWLVANVGRSEDGWGRVEIWRVGLERGHPERSEGSSRQLR